MMDVSNIKATVPPPAPLLSIKGLKTHFATRAGVVKAVDGVDIELGRGEILGLVGESGSGKSITGFSILGLIDPPGRVAGGSITYDGRDLVSMDEEARRELRGNDIAMIFQDPSMTLNPVLRIDTQMIETIQAHASVSTDEARRRSREALVQVGIPSPDERLKAYPYELSGGMRQRIAIAIALINRPKLIIADEPTTALDVSIQGQIIHEVKKLCRKTGTALIWITHDLAVVAGLADRIAVMYAGRIVETGLTADIIERPLHPYTQGLIDSVPSHATRGRRLHQIRGMTPSLLNLPQGCAFRDRCDKATEACLVAPDATEVGERGLVRCWNPAQ
ncbi:ABC transporter ATP-binding protein [Rhizobium sp. RU36D]|uniref:ABC transporter ATP-binding protein n=1 Tax=Rhizobium sp. RU36D TaxID=1907415 RepID=UPI0009D8C0E0|nr:ABC transporter ATP-binding protein [Rhizobium sp. RU36D]SMC95141.1 peptide/nickel transport system ATP-binding protein [Rhizobium sp. RU36D]